MHVLNIGLGGAEENINGVSEFVEVWVQAFVILKAVPSFYYPTKL